MNDTQLNKANIENLTLLWKQMGVRPYRFDGMEKCHVSVSWPNRCWFETEVSVDELPAIVHGINQLPNDLIVPVWPGLVALPDQLESLLKRGGFKVIFEQTAMYLDLDNDPGAVRSTLELMPISSERDVRTWTDIAGRSFGYGMDESVIHKIAVNPDVQLFMAYAGSRPAATAMVFKTGVVVGVHQVGVLPEYRGKGMARELMKDVIRRCTQMPARYVTLQASTVGEPLYSGLGFKRQFKISNYQRIIKVNS